MLRGFWGMSGGLERGSCRQRFMQFGNAFKLALYLVASMPLADPLASSRPKLHWSCPNSLTTMNPKL